MNDGNEHLFAGHDHTHDTTHDLGHFGDDGAALGGHLNHPTAIPGHDIVHGSPGAAHQDWFFQHGNTCVPASVTQVVAEFTGHPIPNENQVMAEMTKLGIQGDMGPHGMPFSDAVKLLGGMGVPSHLEDHATLSQLEHHLDEGRSVIVSVNADPIWNHGHDDPQHPMGHAVLITAIDETTGTVTLSDTGNPHGNEEKVPLSVFEHAWADRGDQMVVTDHPTPHHPGAVLLPMVLNHPTGEAPPDTTDPQPDAPPDPQPATPTDPQPPQPAAPTDPGGTHNYTVQRGDTLWDIAERVYGNGSEYTRIAQASGITNPDLIHPGQVLTIPQ